ncbi:MAG TPA: hypothetical protein VIY90_10650 [Steroidobacteraceae bacterium]
MAAIASVTCSSMLCSVATAQVGGYAVADSNDAVTLERSLFLCQWRVGHGAPDGEPSPVVCTTAAISTDDAVHETKQWWTYWARFSGAENATKAKIRFNADFEAFQSRQRKVPDLAQRLLPQGGELPADDWRVRLVKDLTARAKARVKVNP